MADRTGKSAVESFRTKYPGAYDNYSDKEMLDAIKRKYPGAYEDLTIEDSIAPTGNVLQRAAKFASRAESGGREFMRNPLGGADSYGKGFYNPEQSEPFAQSIVRSELETRPGFMEENKTIPAFLSTLPGNLIGAQVDTMLNPIGAATEAAAGPLMKGIGKVASKVGSPIIKGIKNASKPFGNVLTKKGRLSYFDKVEDSVYGAREKAGPIFKKAIDDIAMNNPGKNVDLSNVVNQIMSSSDPMIQRAIQDSPDLLNIVTHPSGGTDIPLMEAQKALNALTTKVSRNILQGGGKRSMHVPITDLIDDLKLSMSRDFPELKGVRKVYGETVENFRKVRPKVSGDAASKNLFANHNPFKPGGKEFMGGERSEEAFKALVPEDLFKEAIKTRHAKSATDLAKTTAATAATTYGTKKLWDWF